VITDTLTLSVTHLAHMAGGERVLTVCADGSWRALAGDYYEVEDATVRSYYLLGSQRAAIRVYDGGEEDVSSCLPFDGRANPAGAPNGLRRRTVVGRGIESARPVGL
jgi:hypothetical protein